MSAQPNPLSTVYATKRRRRSNKSLRPPPKEPNSETKSNPSKRHRLRLNGELDHLASLLPFESNILSKLDRLSILRLAVAFLRTKTYFQVAMHREKEELVDGPYRRDFLTYDNHILDGEIFLQALNGFLMILDCNGELFFATHTIETYLGFHQSDVIHQSVYELVHSEDREELQRQLGWNSFMGQEDANLSLQELLSPEHNHLLDRSFTVRFRCLLDNTSGFLRLDIRGKIKVLHGQNKKAEDAPLALFCLCTPFGPPSLLEIPHKEVMFKSKHKLDFSFVSMDQRGKEMLQYDDNQMAEFRGYDLVHHDDLAYVASAHAELLKTGASGMIAYRLQAKDSKWQWLQTSSRLVYKNSKPDFIISTHRPLMEEEGRDLLGKRTMDFKVTYLDAGLTSTYFSDNDVPSSNGTTPNNSNTPNSSATKVPKRYKAHLRDFLSSCRTKRSKHTNNSAASSLAAANVVNDIYAAAAGGDPTAAATASAIPYASVYGSAPTSAGATSYSPTESPLYMQQNAITSPYQTIYPVDNRYFSTEYLASYRSLTTYYPEYAASAHAAQYIAGNGYFDSTRPLASLSGYDPSQFNRYFEDNKNSPECKYKTDFSPSITTSTTLPPPPPPHSTD